MNAFPESNFFYLFSNKSQIYLPPENRNCNKIKVPIRFPPLKSEMLFSKKKSNRNIKNLALILLSWEKIRLGILRQKTCIASSLGFSLVSNQKNLRVVSRLIWRKEKSVQTLQDNNIFVFFE